MIPERIKRPTEWLDIIVGQTSGERPRNRSVQDLISNPRLEGLLFVVFEKQEEDYSNLKVRDRSLHSLRSLQKEGVNS